MRLTAILLLFVSFTFSALGQQPGPRYDFEKAIANDTMNYALKNVQQDGNFYFLPFPHLHWTYGFGNLNSNTASERSSNAQLVLQILARFEKTKNVEVITFQLVRDQGAHGASPTFHGIFLKARKRQ